MSLQPDNKKGRETLTAARDVSPVKWYCRGNPNPFWAGESERTEPAGADREGSSRVRTRGTPVQTKDP